jgi:uncharacterized OsmC-like protein
MTAAELKSRQTPLKTRYKDDPASAVVTMRASGTLGQDTITCRVANDGEPIEAGLHPMAGGEEQWACSGEMLLQSLVACAGVTLKAVATALEIPLRGGKVSAEGVLDFRGTLGVSKETPVGFQTIHLRFDLDSDASPEQKQKLLSLTERFCVIFQTLKAPAKITSEIA